MTPADAAASAARKRKRTDADRAYFRRFGARIRAERVRQHMGQVALADAAGVSRNFLSKLEIGDHGCNVLLLTRIARALHVSAGVLADDP